jgi:5'-methylthioadenosine phosphorylase
VAQDSLLEQDSPTTSAGDRLGILAGSSFLGAIPDLPGETRSIQTPRGEVTVRVADRFAFLARHGPGQKLPPHRIPHHAHALALEQLGVRRAVGLFSVGALHPELALGSSVVPEDYLSLHPPPTFADHERLHIVPGLDPHLRRELARVARSTDGPVWDGGVYVETRGPRFETRAEIRFLAHHADVVGMTGASEATLLQERGIAFAMLAVVDNMAHGVGGAQLTLERFEAQLARNRARAVELLAGILDRLPRLMAEGPKVPHQTTSSTPSSEEHDA